MNKYIFALILTLFSHSIFAAEQALKSKFSAPVNWSSSGMTQTINITNGTNKPMYVFVEVAYSTGYGLTIHNCGNVQTIKPGSSAICTADPKTSIDFYAPSVPLKGSYQVEIAS